MLLLVLAAVATALATGLGALPVYALGTVGVRAHAALWGIAGGVMGAAAIQGLLLPALRDSGDGGVAAGFAGGVAFLCLARRALRGHDVRLGRAVGADARRAVLVIVVLFVHSLPEGLALGAAWAGDAARLGVFVFVAIAVQNVPEGTATAIPLRDAGVGRARAFWLAVGTSAPQPIGAIAAYVLVEQVQSLLGVALGAAAGAMLALVIADVAPTALVRGGRLAGLVAGAIAAALSVMGALALGV